MVTLDIWVQKAVSGHTRGREEGYWTNDKLKEMVTVSLLCMFPPNSVTIALYL